VLHNLLNLEINTVIKEGMTAEPMPAVPHALLDLAGDYRNLLAELGVDTTAFLRSEKPWEEPLKWQTADVEGCRSVKLTVSPETFHALRWAAERALEASPEGRSEGPLTPSQQVVLTRIRGNCDAIKLILGRAGDLPAKPPTRADLLSAEYQQSGGGYRVSLPDRLLLRKFWEMGTETVVLQTVIQVDGDVVSRSRDPAQIRNFEQLLTLHREGINSSLTSWHHMVDTVIRLSGAAVKGLTGR